MSLNVHSTAKEASLFMDMHAHSFVASVPSPFAKSIRLEAEHRSGRSEPLNNPSSMDLPSPLAQSSNMDPTTLNGPALSSNLYQVQLPDWYSQYTTSLQFFLNQGQHSVAVQSLAAYINIRLPYQQLSIPISCFNSDTNSSGKGAASQVSLRHYVRRLIVTGNDTPAILEAFFGADWEAGVGSIRRQERINYLFTAKSNGWASTKVAYDILPDEHTPFLRPLHDATEQELSMAETHWSEWLAMEDWMVGSRSPWESST
ncbi:hypothetical protein BJY01DRAFT_68981 [Aspergillus pseudoustus]|uniref:Uncharacterized protein n=1 Tax=Aspergillus pseudoustus TaxID=1810923 RepID=A0ABR4J6I3_9EURO